MNKRLDKSSDLLDFQAEMLGGDCMDAEQLPGFSGAVRGRVRGPGGASASPRPAAGELLRSHEEKKVEGLGVDLTKALALQAIFMKFVKLEIRADFLNGKFLEHGSEDSLILLDAFGSLVFPDQVVPVKDIQVHYQGMAHHLANLLAYSDKTVGVTHDGLQRFISYRRVADLIERLGNDPYWQQDRKPHRQLEDCINHPYTGCRPKSTLVTSSPKVSLSSAAVGPTTKLRERNQTTISPQRRQYSRYIGSSTSTSRSSSTDSHSSDSGSTSSPAKSSDHSRASHRRKTYLSNQYEVHDKRKGVIPLKFVMDGSQSLKSYLKQYEKYFRQTYRGNEYDMSLQLSRFLSGELLDAFTALGGSSAKYYKIIKPQLLGYYKNKHLDSRESWRNKLLEAKMKTGESIEVFGLRLLNIAHRAFPEDRSERESQLRKSFLKGIPSALSVQIGNTERINKSVTGKKRLKYSAMTELAKDLALEKTEKRVTWTASGARPKTELPSDQEERVTGRPLRAIPNNKGKDKPGLPCTYCHKENHTKDSCWRYKGLCLVCGGNHSMRNCRYYNPEHNGRYASRSATQGNGNASSQLEGH